MRRSSLGDLAAALSSVRSLNATVAAHLANREPPPPPTHQTSLSNWYYAVTKKAESLELSKLLITSRAWERSGEMSQELPDDLGLIDVRNGILVINLNAKNANTFLLSMVEHHVSSAKNITDLYAVLLNDIWQLNLPPLSTNIVSIWGRLHERRAAHPLMEVAGRLRSGQSWYRIVEKIRNACQHRDPTGILVSRFGRDAAPLFDQSFFPPDTDERQRSVTQFCPWLADQVYQFMEDAGVALAASPDLQAAAGCAG